MDRSELLLRYGFIKKNKKDNYYYDEKKSWYEPVAGYKLNAKDDASEEEAELVPHNYVKTGYPPPIKTYVLSLEMFDMSLEEPYFWIIDILKENFAILEKLEDSFAAAENSAFFGATQQRLGAQQDKVSQYLATMGKMIKELFQMVRELRIIDERLGYYDRVEKEMGKPLDQRSKSDEITLKGFFVDLVQGGGKNAASVYGMARELEFITLPDLFFDAPTFKNVEELDRYIEGLGKDFNRNVVRVLQRHLNQYREWRIRTHQEHNNRRKFMLQYLLQHYKIIEMYLNWTKPYLRNVSHLTMKEKSMESVDIVSAFEGSMLDVEVLARKENKGAQGCVLVTFNYRTRPEMKFVQEGYQRGPVHVGKMIMTVRGYTWTNKQLENYKKLKKKEEFLLLGEVSSSVKKAMDALGEELEKYLQEAVGNAEKKEEVTETEFKKSLMEKMFGDFYTPSSVKKTIPTKSKRELEAAERSTEKALKGLREDILGACWGTFHYFKKAHDMIAW